VVDMSESLCEVLKPWQQKPVIMDPDIFSLYKYFKKSSGRYSKKDTLRATVEIGYAIVRNSMLNSDMETAKKYLKDVMIYYDQLLQLEKRSDEEFFSIYSVINGVSIPKFLFRKEVFFEGMEDIFFEAFFEVVR
jgi:hypothetical protein